MPEKIVQFLGGTSIKSLIPILRSSSFFRVKYKKKNGTLFNPH